eukprot:TRINITY_DN97604_c0_g1_i1.p1 TRINITY_DN97604_c0_g1~~TRINITY_DN97604_c0_g1_i1.p1  ORF type:complete len:285 (+),score=32.51 TRINITY_DN97604_c0_g1_i1:60-914(+)
MQTKAFIIAAAVVHCLASMNGVATEGNSLDDSDCPSLVQSPKALVTANTGTSSHMELARQPESASASHPAVIFHQMNRTEHASNLSMEGRTLPNEDIVKFTRLDWSTIPYGGNYPFVGKSYLACVIKEHALSIIEDWVLYLLDWQMLIHMPDGNFRRPGESQDIFPAFGNIDLKWKYSEAERVIKYDFYLSPTTSQLADWRFDFLLAKDESFSTFDAVGCASQSCLDPSQRFLWWMKLVTDDNLYETDCGHFFVEHCAHGYSQVTWKWCSWGKWKRVCTSLGKC